MEEEWKMEKITFQSSFYESTYWNWTTRSSTRGNTGLSILILRVYLLKQSLTYAYRNLPCNFQSSFYESTYWNNFSGKNRLNSVLLSILILRVYLLKLHNARAGYVLWWHFQSSFYESTYWNESVHSNLTGTDLHFQSSFYESTYWNTFLDFVCKIDYRTFNPHFTSLPIETRKKRID